MTYSNAFVIIGLISLLLNGCAATDSASEVILPMSPSEEIIYQMLCDAHEQQIQAIVEKAGDITGTWEVETFLFALHGAVSDEPEPIIGEQLIINKDFLFSFRDRIYSIAEAYLEDYNDSVVLDTFFRKILLSDEVAHIVLQQREPDALAAEFELFVSKDSGFYLWWRDETGDISGIYQLSRR